MDKEKRMPRIGNQRNSSHELAMLVDEQYDMSEVKQIINDKQMTVDGVVSGILRIVGDALAADGYREGKRENVKLVVQLSDEVKEAVARGDVRFEISKSGEMFAQLRDKAGKYGKKLTIKPEDIATGINPYDIGTYLQMKAIQKQLTDIMDTLNEIGSRVEDVVRGQQNDRVALYYSGLNMYLEARNVHDKDLRISMTTQALQSLNDANSMMVREIKDNLRYIINKEYKEDKRSIDKIHEKMNTINKCFDIIHKSTVIKTAIYYDEGELSAMMTVVDEYRRFIEKMIIPFSEVLSEHDRNDFYLHDGIWEKRVKSLSAMQDLETLVESKNVFYIGTEDNQYVAG